jgi:alkyldihydroxyacetonephosphate synthase
VSLKTEEKSKLHEVVNQAKKYFVTQVMKFNPDKMCLCTILFEGRKDEVENQQKTVYALAKKNQGFRAGAENGERGYFLTYMIGYLRDFGFKYHFVAESFETSIPWKDVSKMCSAVSNRIVSDCKKIGVKKAPFISFRISQVNIGLILGL